MYYLSCNNFERHPAIHMPSRARATAPLIVVTTSKQSAFIPVRPLGANTAPYIPNIVFIKWKKYSYIFILQATHMPPSRCNALSFCDDSNSHEIPFFKKFQKLIFQSPWALQITCFRLVHSRKRPHFKLK